MILVNFIGGQTDAPMKLDLATFLERLDNGTAVPVQLRGGTVQLMPSAIIYYYDDSEIT